MLAIQSSLSYRTARSQSYREQAKLKKKRLEPLPEGLIKLAGELSRNFDYAESIYFRGITYNVEDREHPIVELHVPRETIIETIELNSKSIYCSSIGTTAFKLSLPDNEPIIIPEEYRGLYVEILKNES